MATIATIEVETGRILSLSRPDGHFRIEGECIPGCGKCCHPPTIPSECDRLLTDGTCGIQGLKPYWCVMYPALAAKLPDGCTLSLVPVEEEKGS